jgi:predicted ferric reductase
MDGPLLWYLNRGTGFVLLALFTAAVVLGILSTHARAGGRVPGFVTQALHRNLALLSVSMLVAHVATAVADTYVDIRWWQALVPYVGATYAPVWLGLGTLALDLFVAVTVTSLLRTRMKHRSWRAVHLLAYAGWVLSVGHALGIGTDLRNGAGWAIAITTACVAVAAAAASLRVAGLLARRPGAAVGR